MEHWPVLEMMFVMYQRYMYWTLIIGDKNHLNTLIFNFFWFSTCPLKYKHEISRSAGKFSCKENCSWILSDTVNKKREQLRTPLISDQFHK